MDARTIRRILSSQPGFWGCFARDNLPSFEGRKPKRVIRDACKREGAKYVSLVCNTDRLSGTGIHWVAIMISKNGYCYLFNSLGGLPEKSEEILQFCNQFEKCFYNKNGHQKENEITCGAFAAYCISEINKKGTTFARIVGNFESKIANDDGFVRDWLLREHNVRLPPV